MNHGWRNTVAIVSVVFLQILPLLSQASPSLQKSETDTMASESYVTDWHVDHSISTSASTPLELSHGSHGGSLADTVPPEATTLSGGPMDSPWPMLSHDSVHSGRSQYNTENVSGAELWQVHGDSLGEVWSSAVIDKNGTIYFGTLGSDSGLYAMYPNGTRIWKYKATGLLWSTPAMAEDGTIYFGTWGSSRESSFLAVKPNGKLKWSYSSGNSNSPAIAEDGTIYYGGDNGLIYALYPNGTLKWNYHTGYSVIGCPAIGSDGTIYIGSGDYYLYAMNPNGTLRWRFDTGGYIKGSASIAPDGTIYVPSFDGYLYAVNPNGTMRWKASTGGSVAGAGVALASDGTIYIGTDQLRAFHPNGTLKWCTNVQGYVSATVPAVSGDGTIFVTAGGSLVAVNPDGTMKWRSQISNEQSHSSPCIGPNDRVYVGSRYRDYGYLHAIGPGEPKTIKILTPVPGHLYYFDQDLGRTPRNRTIIFGSATVKVRVSSPEDIESVSFDFNGHHTSVTSPPFEWTMNRRYGKTLIKSTITVVGFFKGGSFWTESMPVVYFHFL